MNIINSKELRIFQATIWDYYESHGREFAWRNIDDPYKVLISEVMLQQTQTKRVIEKYEQFLAEFRSFETLAQATLRDVLSIWQGLGYNRRGKFLHKLAQIIVAEYDGKVPNDPSLLEKLPGIGPATAASICAFAFNNPTVFIETNIRAVFLHFFFAEKEGVHDKEILPLVEQAVDINNSREWYYALMDYGVMLKQAIPNPSRASKHHSKQSKFVGSDRQIRGRIIKILVEKEHVSFDLLMLDIKCDSSRLKIIVEQLLLEGLISQHREKILIV